MSPPLESFEDELSAVQTWWERLNYRLAHYRHPQRIQKRLTQANIRLTLAGYYLLLVIGTLATLFLSLVLGLPLLVLQPQIG